LAKSDDKIEELHQEKTEVVVGAQEIIKINLLCLSDTQQEWSNYTDSSVKWKRSRKPMQRHLKEELK
jgi:hypothetical protein